jgi:hypothetical protein
MTSLSVLRRPRMFTDDNATLMTFLFNSRDPRMFTDDKATLMTFLLVLRDPRMYTSDSGTLKAFLFVLRDPRMYTGDSGTLKASLFVSLDCQYLQQQALSKRPAPLNLDYCRVCLWEPWDRFQGSLRENLFLFLTPVEL